MMRQAGRYQQVWFSETPDMGCLCMASSACVMQVLLQAYRDLAKKHPSFRERFAACVKSSF